MESVAFIFSTNRVPDDSYLYMPKRSAIQIVMLWRDNVCAGQPI